jgi:hypothetical protein
VKIFKFISIAVIICFIIIQFLPIKLPKNDNNTEVYLIPGVSLDINISGILKTSCFDCHSNHVNYPWYSHIAPVSWLIKHDITEGREKLNFSEWSNYSKQRQIRKLTDIKEEIKGGMPLAPYTLIHSNSKLTDEQKKIIGVWCDKLCDEILNSKR